MNVAEPPSLRDGYRRDIDGLRTIAVLSVVLYHAGVSAVRGGYVGVDIFFVISGYLIGAHLYRDVVEGRFSVARFYQRRAKRILPALFVVVLFVYAAGLLLLSPIELNAAARFAFTSVFSVSNVYAWLHSSYFDFRLIQQPLLMTWSLGVEEHFYVFFPLLMLFFAGYAKRGERQRERMPRLLLSTMLAVIVATLALCLWETRHDSTAAFYLLPFRAWELAVGVWMAVHEAQPREGAPYGGGRLWAEVRGVAGVAAMLTAVVRFGPGTLFPGPGAVLPVVGAALVLSAPEAWVNRRVLGCPPMRGIGLVSYSWYLWHWPLLSLTILTLGASLVPPLPVALGAVTVALGMAWLSYRFVEQPFRRSTMAPGPLLRRYGLACVLMALPAVPMVLTRGLPQRYPLVGVQDRMMELQQVPCLTSGLPIESEECTPKPDGRPAIALLGDSHATMLAPRLMELAKANGMRSIVMTHTSCPPLLGAVRHGVYPGVDGPCIEFNRRAVQMLDSDPTVKTVLLIGLWDAPFALDPPGDRGYLPVNAQGEITAAKVSEAESDANFARGLSGIVEALRGAGKRVVLLQDVESFRFESPLRMRSALMPARRGLATLLTGVRPTLDPVQAKDMYLVENRRAAQIVAQVGAREGVEVFDLRSKLCDATTCDYFLDGKLMYRDPNHLTTAGVERVLQGLELR